MYEGQLALIGHSQSAGAVLPAEAGEVTEEPPQYMAAIWTFLEMLL
jgi:hypothetical protein